ncbi:MAG TPA: DUF2255 family protein [Candidatus Limnocylindrales bacterium]|nr:DUF2255 family protein [Candidatus Limnocylindrales bacterium]
MATWTKDELIRIAGAEELELSSQRRDGTLRDAVTMWVVREGENLYVRSMHGRTSVWYRGTQTRHQGHIGAGGVSKEVSFGDASGDPSLNKRIDAAYREKYRRYGDDMVGAVVNPGSRAATIKLEPR